MQLYSRRFSRLARTASYRTKRWLMRWPRTSTWRAASRCLPTRIYATRGTAMTAGRACEGEATMNATRTCKRNEILAPTATIARPSGIGVETVVKPRRHSRARSSSTSDREAHANRGEMQGASGVCSSSSGRRAPDRGGGHHRRWQGWVAVRQAAVTPSDLPQSALHYVVRTRSAWCWTTLRPVTCIRRTSTCGRSIPDPPLPAHR